MEKMVKATKPEMGSYEAYIEEIKSIWETGSMTNNGSKVQMFREKLKLYTNCQNIDLFVNGHAALVLGLKILELPIGGEVLTSPFTFVSTTNAIVQNGLVPVFCDIDSTYNIDINSIKRNITEKTCAIATPHIFGIPCHVEEIEKIAKQHNLKVIYDGAQAFGTKVNGKNIAEYGDVTMFSFHAIKVFNAIEGGALVYKNKGLQEKLELNRNFGIEYGQKNDVVVDGINAKMTEFSAAMGLTNLPRINEVIKRRKELAEYYVECFADIPGIYFYSYEKHIDYNYAYFPIIVDLKECAITRDEMWEELKKYGIETRKLYDTLTCDFSYYKDKGYKRDVEYATEITKKCLDFPMYSELKEEDIEYIAMCLKNIVNKH